MARYIDADALMEEIHRIGGHNLCEWHTIGVKALVDRQPTADVAPMAEVERLQRILDSYALQYGTATDKEVFLKKERAATVRKMQAMIEERCLKGCIYPAFVKNTINKVAEELIGGISDDTV